MTSLDYKGQSSSVSTDNQHKLMLVFSLLFLNFEDLPKLLNEEDLKKKRKGRSQRPLD